MASPDRAASVSLLGRVIANRAMAAVRAAVHAGAPDVEAAHAGLAVLTRALSGHLTPDYRRTALACYGVVAATERAALGDYETMAVDGRVN